MDEIKKSNMRNIIILLVLFLTACGHNPLGENKKGE